MALNTFIIPRHEPENPPSEDTRGLMLHVLDRIYSRLTDAAALDVIYWLRDALDGAELTIIRGTTSADEEGLARA